MGEDVGQKILLRLEEAARWRERLDGQMMTLSHQVAELATEVRVRAEHQDQRHRVTEKRLLALESGLRGGGESDFDVTVTNTNSASAGGISLGKAAAATGATGIGAWLLGGGWDQITAAFKKLTG